MDYLKAYAILVGTMSDAIDEIGKSYIISPAMEHTAQLLKEELARAEEMYLCSEE